MNSRHRYALAFSMTLLPVLIGAGVHLVEQDTTEVCGTCGSAHKIREQHWNVWGISGHRMLRDEIEPHRLFQRDFPEYHCDHGWSSGSTKRIRTWDGPVRVAVSPVPPEEYWETMCCVSRLGELFALYEDSEWFRFLLNDAVEDELITRGQVAAWFKAKASSDPRLDEMDEEETAAFKRLDEILKRVEGPHFSPVPLPFPFIPGSAGERRLLDFAPLPVQGLPKAREQI